MTVPGLFQQTANQDLPADLCLSGISCGTPSCSWSQRTPLPGESGFLTPGGTAAAIELEAGNFGISLWNVQTHQEFGLRGLGRELLPTSACLKIDDIGILDGSEALKRCIKLAGHDEDYSSGIR
jgi:hypothetical protein